MLRPEKRRLLPQADDGTADPEDYQLHKQPSRWRSLVRRALVTFLLFVMTILSLLLFFFLGRIISGHPQGPVRDTQPPVHNPIKNVVVVVQENLSFDTFAGGLTYNADIDGLIRTQYCNPANISDPESPQICAKPTAQDIAPDDPDHSIAGGNLQIYGTYDPKPGTDRPTMQGFVTEQVRAYGLDGDLGRAAEVINYYPPDGVRVLNALAENFLLFDRWFASVPGPTNPNRAYLTSGTSHGHGSNDPDFDTSSLPQVSIFEQLTAANISWINYSNTTGFLPDALFYTWTKISGHGVSNVKPIDQFYKDAKAGTLPQFTWINPECCSFTSFHPPSPVHLGEGFLKSIYEALRASPQWNETLFILTFDEHGGFADHVPPPENVPAGDDLPYTEAARDGTQTTFRFDRLGVRVPTLLISPWVDKGAVQHGPTDQPNDFTHTSILKYVAELWDLPLLTPRVAWSPSFGSLIRDSSRSDTPERLPEP
ncbi:PLC-A [Aspergillus japonicus CBS 114.51]|uniref:PLC-A n=1 Tax=Aspergillus japonicus CBS 114.51 TaxID=1448312 RepID=A0A8T8WTA7_ASPJA|nr:PLC-A [Aspergillus japonicus CBS 114.51]RAH79076.1 PLC-A [Aspergillus japonicus CBS 114.51]